MCVYVFVCAQRPPMFVQTTQYTHTHTSSATGGHAYKSETQDWTPTHTFLFLPCLQVAVTESGWHWKRKDRRKHFVTMETAGRQDTWSNHGDRRGGWFFKVLRHSFFTCLLNKNVISAHWIRCEKSNLNHLGSSLVSGSFKCLSSFVWFKIIIFHEFSDCLLNFSIQYKLQSEPQKHTHWKHTHTS